MKKIMSLYFVVIIIGTLFLITGCTKNNSAEVIKTEFEVVKEKVELEKVSILSNKVDILLPKSFSIMSEEMAKTKYPSENRPTIIYTNASGSVNISLNHTQNKATNSQISAYMDILKESFENLYPSAQWYNSSVEKINYIIQLYKRANEWLETNSEKYYEFATI